MSLSTWFKDYVYIPLGGNRVGKGRNILNIMIVWGLTGMWHGASWNFIIWGIYFGTILLVEKFLLKPLLEASPRPLQHIYSMFFVIIGWVIFMNDTPSDIIHYIGRMFTVGNFIDIQFQYMISNFAIVLLACLVFCLPIGRMIKIKKTKAYDIAYAVFHILIFALSIVYIVDNTFNPFLYFRF